MSSTANHTEAANLQAEPANLPAEPDAAETMPDPLVAKASALFDVFAAKYRQLSEKPAEPEIPADVPRFTTEQSPWAF